MIVAILIYVFFTLPFDFASLISWIRIQFEYRVNEIVATPTHIYIPTYHANGEMWGLNANFIPNCTNISDCICVLATWRYRYILYTIYTMLGYINHFFQLQKVIDILTLSAMALIWQMCPQATINLYIDECDSYLCFRSIKQSRQQSAQSGKWEMYIDSLP